ncbi:glycosyltransferase family 39 protein [Butyrivibrio sp. AE3004]|uniref:glycosyltransferase family 39 protein n=1 Tax=Butyrivibrio sp. AE3004 TaxID=1506994 RepID=UPI000493D614|nr:glycosyltransferase family 39 protein [Butyrivibrio sp. AE3004]
MKTNNGLNKKQLYFIAVYMIAIFSRLVFLGSTPSGLHVDEAGMAYDAYCLANYGVDRNLLSFPVYLINFGGGQSALYAYLAAIFVKFLGLNVWALRLPGAIFSLITLFAGEKIVRIICGEDSIAEYIYPIIFTCCPVFVMSARFGLDCNLMLGMTTLFLYTMMRAIGSEKTGDYALAGLLAGATLYTYAISYAIMPLFLAVLFVILLVSRKLSALRVISFVIPLAILAAPLLVTQYVNINGKESIVFGIITMPALTFYRGGEIIAPSLTGLLNALKSVFLYDSLDYNSIPAFGTMYYVTIPFIVIGMVRSIISIKDSAKIKTFGFAILPVLWFACELLIGAMLGGDGPNVNKMNGIFFTLAFFAAFGMETVLLLFSKKRKAMIASCTLLACVFIGLSGAFFIKYFGEYSDNLYLFQKTIDEPLKVLEKEEYFVDKQVVFIHDNQPYIPPYIFFLLGTKLSPYDFNMNDTSYYARYLFNPPDELSCDYIYLVFDGNDERVESLQNMGCDQILKFDGALLIWQGEQIEYTEASSSEEKEEGIPFGHDLPFHIRRIAGIAEGLRDGEFPVKMQHYWFNNYGYPVGVMYGDALLYIPAILHLLGMPLWMTYICYCIFIQLLTAFTAYICFKYLSGSRRFGALCMLLYFLSFWRLTDLFTRQAVGEYSAFAFLPLIVLGLSRIHRDDKSERGVVLLCLGMTGLFMTHLLSVIMATLFIVIFVIADAKNMLLKGKWKKLAFAAGSALLLNLWQIVPLIDYYKNVPMLINSGETTPIQTFGITWKQMFGAYYDVVAPMRELGNEPITEMPQSPGISLIMIMIAFVIYLFSNRKELEKHVAEIITGALALLALVLSTCYFPYDMLYNKVKILFKILGSIQYPPRYLTAATILICALYAVMLGKKKWYKLGIILLVISIWQSGSYVRCFIEKQTVKVAVNNFEDWTSFDDDRQYMIVGTDTERLQYASVLPSSEDITYFDEERKDGEYSLHLVNSTTNEGFADLPLLAYPYYYGTDGNEKYELTSGDNNKLRVTVPKGTDSVIKIRFREPLYWRISEIISLAFLMIMIGFGVRKIIKK